MKNRIICFIAMCTLVLSSVTTVFANENNASPSTSAKTTTEFDIDNYELYTIDFSTSPTTKSNSESNVDKAIQYVKSLNLPDKGFTYIEESCLAELKGYASDDVKLTSYTVLVPISPTATKTFFGSYGGYDFYYDTTSFSSFEKRHEGKTRQDVTTRWAQWMKGTFELVATLVTDNFDIPYAVIGAVLGIFEPSQISYEAYLEYYCTYGSDLNNNRVKTRSIYRKSGSTYRLAYQDQSGPVTVDLIFHSNDAAIGVRSDNYSYMDSVSSTTHSKNQILQIANTQANRGSKVTYLLSAPNISENW